MDYKQRKTEQGNVLFLILIAVALFAALSYAVTQSTRGGGNADDETSLISSAALTQYPASLKTSVLRMSITDGVGDDVIKFNPPSDISDCETDIAGSATGSDATSCVFSSNGGSASYQQAPSNVMAGSTLGTWVFNADNEVQDIGTTVGGDSPSIASREIIAFLVGISSGICQKINDELGITGIPDENAGLDITTQLDDTTNGDAPTAGGGTIGDTGVANTANLNGQPFGCFESNSTGTYVYYHTLSEN